MSESEWLTAAEPLPMWEYLSRAGSPSDRKLKLWVEACRSQIGPQRWANRMETTAQIQTAAYDVARANCYVDECPKALRAALLRCAFGNPFAVPAALPRTAATLSLARQIYAERDFALMGLLRDALMDGGCDDLEALSHCLESGHVRGCFCLDLILGKS